MTPELVGTDGSPSAVRSSGTVCLECWCLGPGVRVLRSDVGERDVGGRSGQVLVGQVAPDALPGAARFVRFRKAVCSNEVEGFRVDVDVAGRQRTCGASPHGLDPDAFNGAPIEL